MNASACQRKIDRQRLEDLYKKLLLMDLEYALDKKVEQDLYVFVDVDIWLIP